MVSLFAARKNSKTIGSLTIFAFGIKLKICALHVPSPFPFGEAVGRRV